MADTKEDEQTSHVVSEGMIGSTPDNYEGVEEAEPLPPITVAQRDALLSAPLVSPADESRLAAKKEFDAKPKDGAEVQAALDAESAKAAEKVAKEEDEFAAGAESAPKATTTSSKSTSSK
jgi:hypothetical protein